MIRAIQFVDRDDHRRTKTPGSFFLNLPDGTDLAQFTFYCPCGCGDLAIIILGVKHKPRDAGPTWEWNGSLSIPTLHPSVHNTRCGWHGWLRDGYWEVC